MIFWVSQAPSSLSFSALDACGPSRRVIASVATRLLSCGLLPMSGSTRTWSSIK